MPSNISGIIRRYEIWNPRLNVQNLVFSGSVATKVLHEHFEGAAQQMLDIWLGSILCPVVLFFQALAQAIRTCMPTAWYSTWLQDCP
jgi:hypothetical protein